MSCSTGRLVSRAGKTMRFQFLFRDKATQVAESLAGLKGRMTFRLTPTSAASLLDLTNGAGVTVQPSAQTGVVAIELTVAQSRLLAPGNLRTECVGGLELYDDSVSPESVEYSEVIGIVMLPDLTP